MKKLSLNFDENRLGNLERKNPLFKFYGNFKTHLAANVKQTQIVSIKLISTIINF